MYRIQYSPVFLAWLIIRESDGKAIGKTTSRKAALAKIEELNKGN